MQTLPLGAGLLVVAFHFGLHFAPLLFGGGQFSGDGRQFLMQPHGLGSVGGFEEPGVDFALPHVKAFDGPLQAGELLAKLTLLLIARLAIVIAGGQLGLAGRLPGRHLALARRRSLC